MSERKAKTSAAAKSERKWFSFELGGVLKWVLIIVFACYANSLLNDYNMDDELVTINHPITKNGLSAIPQILKSPYFTDGYYAYEYRPVVHVSFAIEHQIFGENAFTSHLINLLLYLILILVAFDFFKKFFPDLNEFLIGFILLLWAIHPTHTEVVSSIKNRDEILALLFALLAWRESLRYVSEKKHWRILAVAALITLAMGSKITVIVFAAIIPLSLEFMNATNFPKKFIVAATVGFLSAMWLNNITLLQQIFIGAVSPAIISIIYFFRNATFLKSGYSTPANAAQGESGMFIPSGFFSQPLSYLFTTLWVLLFALAIYSGVQLHLNIFFLLAVMFTLWRPEQELRFWMFLLLVFLAVLSLFYNYDTNENYMLFITAFIAGSIWKTDGKKSMYIKLLHLGVFLGIYFQGLDSIYVTLPILLLFNSKFFNRYVFIFMIIAAFSFSIYALISKLVDTSFGFFFFSSLLLFFSVIYFLNQRRLSAKKAFGILGICVVIGMTANNLLSNTATEKLAEKRIVKDAGSLFNKAVSQAGATAPINIVPTQTNRPILFAEFPVDLVNDPLSVKVSTSADVLFRYLKLTLIPFPLSFYYGYAVIKPVDVNPISVFSILIHIGFFISAFFLRNNKLYVLGVLIYLAGIAPFSGYLTMIPGVMADRYLFAPTFGFALCLTALIIFLLKINPQNFDWKQARVNSKFKYTATALLLVYSSLTIARNFDWKDRLTLFQRDIKYVSNSAQAHNLLAYHLNKVAMQKTDPFEQRKMIEEAAFHFKTATEIWPGFMNAMYDLGRTHEQLGNWKLAASAYQKTYLIDTSFTDAIFRLGIIYENLNNIDSAIVCYVAVVNQNPENITAFNNLSYCFFKKKDYRSAIETSRQAAAQHPTNSDPVVNIGKTFLHINETDSALVYFEKAYPIRSDDRGLVEVLYKLWNERGNEQKKTFYYQRMRELGMVR